MQRKHFLGGVTAIMVTVFVVAGATWFCSYRNRTALIDSSLHRWNQLGNEWWEFEKEGYVLEIKPGAALDSEELAILETLAPYIWKLKADGSKLRDDDLRSLEHASNLEIVRVGNTDIDGTGFRHLQKCQKLASIAAWNTKINDATISHIAAIPGLRSLNIEGCPISVEAVDVLGRSSNVYSLSVYSPQTITLDEFREALGRFGRDVFAGYLNIDQTTKEQLVRESPPNVKGWAINYDPEFKIP